MKLEPLGGAPPADDTPLLPEFNAVKRSPREVAQSFVPPPFFPQLLSADNVVLTGPRGSGKTTLLKMLHPEALEFWSDEAADEVRRRVRFSGIFVGVDRSWHAQLTSGGGGEPPASLQALAGSAFTTHVLAETIECMIYRTKKEHDPDSVAFLRVELDPDRERALSEELSRLLMLPVIGPSLRTISIELRRRIRDLGIYRKRILRTGSVELPEYVDLECLSTTAAAVATFNDMTGEGDRRWALLIDELEMAPSGLVHELLGALRAHQSQLSFKLSLFPVHQELTELEGSHGAVPGQDFEHIPLTYARKLPAMRFARSLFAAELARPGSAAPSPEKVLGPSMFDSSDDPVDIGVTPLTDARKGRKGGVPDPYRTGSDLWNVFKKLSDRDKSFRAWLRKHDIDLKNLESLPPQRRAAKLRKIRNLVVVREHYSGGLGRLRSRKSYELYTGAEGLLALPDGNPRFLIVLLRKLLSAGGETRSRRVPRSHQSRAIDETLQRFLALLQSQESIEVGGQLLSVLSFIDIVGRGLSQRINRDPFTDNAPSQFRVDSRTPSEMRELLRGAVNAGGVIHIPQDGEFPLGSDLTGHTFRLSYLLAPYYHLPLRMGHTVALSNLVPADLIERPSKPSSSEGDVGALPTLFQDPEEGTEE